MINVQWILVLLTVLVIIARPIQIGFIDKLIKKIRINYTFVFICISIIIVFLRLYKLKYIPNGINVDEAGLIYDSMSISKDGVDRYGFNYPIYLNNYGQGMSTLYLYLNILISFSKITLFKTRFVIAFLSIIMALVSFLIVKRRFGYNYGLLIYFLIGTLPYFVMSSRWALDCDLLVIFSTFAIYLYLLAIEKNENKYYFLTGVLFGITLYSYALSYVLIPIFLFFSILYLLLKHKINIKNIISMGVPIFLIAIPLFLFIAVNYDLIEEFKLFNVFSINKISDFRSSELSVLNIFKNWNLIKIYLLGLEMDFSVITQYSTIYYFSIPLIIYGVLKTLPKFKDDYNQDQILLIYLFSCILVTLIIEDPNITKSNFVYFVLIYFVIVGVKNLAMKTNLFHLIVLSYIIMSVFFTKYYFLTYSKFTPLFFEKNLYDAVNFMEENSPNEKNFIDMGTDYLSHIPILITLDASYQEHSYSYVRNYDLYLDTSIDYDNYLIRSDNYQDLESLLLYKGYLMQDIDGFRVYSK